MEGCESPVSFGADGERECRVPGGGTLSGPSEHPSQAGLCGGPQRVLGGPFIPVVSACR